MGVVSLSLRNVKAKASEISAQSQVKPKHTRSYEPSIFAHQHTKFAQMYTGQHKNSKQTQNVAQTNTTHYLLLCPISVFSYFLPIY